MLSRLEDRAPQVGTRYYVHPNADVIGDVTIGRDCWVGPGARIRGDYGRILIGDCTAVEDNVVIHARPGEQTTIGAWVTLGHGAIIHNATIHDWAIIGMGSIVSDWAVIGMGSIVSDWAVIGEWAVVAEGAVVTQRTTVPAEGRVAGVPARLLDRPVGADYKSQWKAFKQIYVDLARRYPAGLGEASQHFGDTAMTLEGLLKDKGIPFEAHDHPTTYTAQGLAHEEHVSGYMVAKPVIVKTGSAFVMCVIPAPAHVSLPRVGEVVGDPNVRLATESEMADLFPDCDLGAEPPVGVLFGLKTIMVTRLQEDEELVMQAGTHTHSIRMRREDWERVTEPVVAPISTG